MTILMPSLSRDKNGDWFSRKGIPADVRDDYQRTYGLRQEERFRRPSSLSPGEAKAEFAGWLEEIERRINTFRSAKAGQAQSLSPRQIHILVGRWYDWFIAQAEAEGSSVDLWDHRYEEYERAVEAVGGLGRASDGEDDRERSTWHQALVRAKVIEISKLPSFLAAEGVKLDHGSHDRLVDTLERDMVAALAALRRRAGGDYSPDHHRAKFPAEETPQLAPGNVKLAGWTAWEAFEAWVAERKPAPSTVNRWRGVFLNLNVFLNKRDIALVTDEDAVAWKDKLVAGGAGARTIKEIWIASAKRVFGYATDQKKIKANPFAGLKVAGGKAGLTKGGFSDDAVEAILKATLVPSSLRTAVTFANAKRWVPWLCAYTGSRPGEMTQLRKEDVQRHKDGFWMIQITPDAGTVKGATPRTAVVHDHLIEQGFLNFIETAKPGPLFYEMARKRKKADEATNPPRPQYVQTRQKLAAWVRNDVGVKDANVSPNHGWRHTFKRRAARAGIEQRIRDAFCGHAPGTVGAIYEVPSVEDLAEAIKRFPRYPIDAS